MPMVSLKLMAGAARSTVVASASVPAPPGVFLPGESFSFTVCVSLLRTPPVSFTVVLSVHSQCLKPDRRTFVCGYN